MERIYKKLIATITSCETKDHLIGARRMINRSFDKLSDELLMKVCLCFDIRKEVLNCELHFDALNYESLGNDMYNAEIYDVAEIMYRAGIEKVKDYKKEV